MDKIELLAPAGNLEKAKIALIYGADAVCIFAESENLICTGDSLCIVWTGDHAKTDRNCNLSFTKRIWQQYERRVRCDWAAVWESQNERDSCVFSDGRTVWRSIRDNGGIAFRGFAEVDGTGQTASAGL